MIREFLSAAGLTQAVRGFDADMVMMNPSFEREVIPGALDDLLDDLIVSWVFVGLPHQRIASHDSGPLAIGRAAATLASYKAPRSA